MSPKIFGLPEIVVSIGIGASLGAMSMSPESVTSSVGSGGAASCSIWDSAYQRSASSLPNINEIESRFDKLATEWREASAHLPTINKMAMHQSYQRIIGIGELAVPLLLRSLEQKPEHWFWALHAITGVNPVSEKSAGKLSDMAADWIHWGKQQGYSW